jgi:hypothetical protein
MEKYISQSTLEVFYKKELKILGKDGVEEKIGKKRREFVSGQKARKTIFLSHSHLDKTIVNKIGLLFDNLDAELYVDWLDKTLPETTNKVTASAIKTKIQDCHHFLFLATYHGLRSKWCNWELGIADSLKSENKLAILPIQSKAGNWSGNEYLQLYPEMKIENDDLDSLTISQISIQPLEGKAVSLEKWLLT